MRQNTPLFLQYAALGTAVVGVAMVLTALLGGLGQLEQAIRSFSPALDTAELSFGIAGAVLAGWGISLAAVSAPKATRLRVNLAALAVWFILDSAASLAAGCPANVASNLGFLLVLAIPLGRLLKHAEKESLCPRHG